VTGTARPLHVGKRSQVWEVRIEDDKVAVLPATEQGG